MGVVNHGHIPSLDGNNTDMLIGDMARRQSLDINKFLLFAVLGQYIGAAYSIAYPEHVSGLILRGIFLGTAGSTGF